MSHQQGFADKKATAGTNLLVRMMSARAGTQILGPCQQDSQQKETGTPTSQPRSTGRIGIRLWLRSFWNLLSPVLGLPFNNDFFRFSAGVHVGI